MEAEAVGFGRQLLDVYGPIIINSIMLTVAVYFLWRQHVKDMEEIKAITDKYYQQAQELSRLQEKLHTTLDSVIRSISLEEVVQDAIRNEMREMTR